MQERDEEVDASEAWEHVADTTGDTSAEGALHVSPKPTRSWGSVQDVRLGVRIRIRIRFGAWGILQDARVTVTARGEGLGPGAQFRKRRFASS